MNVSASAPKQLRGTDLTRQRIEIAALRLFAQRGTETINIKELASAAGMARGTIYNNIDSIETLFDDLVGAIAANMHERIHQSFAQVSDPAHRLAMGIRLILREVHNNPAWGQFFHRFALTTAQLREVWNGQPMRDLQQGVDSGRYTIKPDLLPTSTAMIAGTVVGAARLIIDGHSGWLECGREAAELVLRALGLSPEDARTLAGTDLPDIEFPALPGLLS